MHPATLQLSNDIRASSELGTQLELLRGAYASDRCVVVTCGPSLGDVPTDRLRSALEGTLTIAVKQATDTVGSQADFICFNSFNVTKYRSASPNTIRCLVQEPTGRIPQFNRADVRFRQNGDGGHLQRSLAATHQFGDHLLDAQAPRPWGPGIMYELVLHLAVHLGVSEIITIGWDIGNAQGHNTHFYDPDVPGSKFDVERGDAVAAASVRQRLPEPVRRAARWTRALESHARGHLYNRALPVAGEADLIAASTGAANKWLDDNGVHLVVVTPSDRLDDEIERWSSDQFFDRVSST